jgi:hypothetical protein
VWGGGVGVGGEGGGGGGRSSPSHLLYTNKCLRMTESSR